LTEIKEYDRNKSETRIGRKKIKVWAVNLREGIIRNKKQNILE